MSDSLSAPEYRYTDRDVRENPLLRGAAEEYTIVYGGEFEPMIAAKFELRNVGEGYQSVKVFLIIMVVIVILAIIDMELPS
jgi:hypothetical protein